MINNVFLYGLAIVFISVLQRIVRLWLLIAIINNDVINIFMHFVKACFPLVISTEVELLDQMETQNFPLEELSNYFLMAASLTFLSAIHESFSFYTYSIILTTVSLF